MTQLDIDKIIGQVTRRLLMVLLPTIIMTVGGMFLRDHFALSVKADREAVHADMFQLELLIENKVRAIEDLTISNNKLILGNVADIEHMEEKVDEIKEINDKIRDIMIKEFGVNRGIPELSTN